jgi:hypothetical protein
MILTIYRSPRALWHRDDLVRAWDAWTFEPQPLLTRESPPGVSKVRWSSVPVEVHAPMGSRLVPHQFEPARYPPRLATYFDPIGLDAESVFWLASQGARGFRLAAEPAREAVTS